jgi:multiple sugar transport system substrate-binding protein
MNSPPISRRNLLRGTGLAALGGLGLSGLTACGSPFASGVAGTGPSANTLAYWNLLGGGDGVRMVAMQDEYRKLHPEVNLEAVTLAWGNPYYTKVTLSTLGDQPPDVAIAHLTRATILADANLLEPLEGPLLDKYGLTADNFTSTQWDKAHTNGKLYAIPLDTHPFVMFYNTDICQKAGLLDASGQLKSLDGPTALVEALKAAKDVTKGYGGVISINNDTATQWRLFSSLYYQLGGGAVLGDQGRQIVLKDDLAEQSLDYIAGLTVRDKLMPSSVDYGAALTTFASGQAGFYFEGDWEVSTFLTAKTPFSMTQLPNVFGGQYYVQADSHSFVLPRDAKRDDKRREVIFGFIRSMLDQSKTWAEGGHIPAWKPFVDGSEYDTIKPQSNYKGVAEAARYDDPGWYSGSGSDFEYIVGSAIATVSAGQSSPKEAVANMRTRLTKYANTAAPV